ncbi:MAG: Rieske (2Fe-2S) protein [Burkholderiales bacterium]|nr:MAG: Rieske (2Fe-2S) protein [Burkholderiales bacterium]
MDVCASEALPEGGDGVRFEWPDPADGGRPSAAFVVRYDGCARAFLNRCAHLRAELDWLPGRFFDDSGLYLICATHGALYEADSGRCVAGPCSGGRLAPLRCVERDGRVRVAVGRPVDR